MKSQIHQLLDKLPFTSSVKFNGIILPPKRRRWCGSEFRDDDYFFQSAILEAKRLKFEFGIKNNDNILDIGCGFGRLPIGLNKIFDSINYSGIDVHRPSIDWCKKFLSKNTPQLNFIHFNIINSFLIFLTIFIIYLIPIYFEKKNILSLINFYKEKKNNFVNFVYNKYFFILFF